MIGHRKVGRQGTHFRRSLDQKRQILDVLDKDGPQAITRLFNLIELNYGDTKRLVSELVAADLVYMTTAAKAGLTEIDTQAHYRHRPLFQDKQYVFVITSKGKRCLGLMNRSVLVLDKTIPKR